ncbi:glycosyltransferase family 39 protein [Actinomadura graeca]|uniref:Glycosyltransferase family 39 protein n=1 Tax=Actinomadura graeca TaxID=2750812 RepID=A0ABX8QZZ2_9ACTN|nr:glycosyltransferase family 39 protein [Actinomadura graeca]QXJ22358.1 glycosyltransferase family 39 protein [Actinomadura graeca]
MGIDRKPRTPEPPADAPEAPESPDTQGTDEVTAAPGGRGPQVLAFATALVAGTAGISMASPWRDEAATVSATRRTLPELWRLLGHTDAVHGAYYLLLHPLVRVFGSGEAVLRLPSVLAVAVAAAGVAWLGQRLDGRRTGVLAGAAFALTPTVGRYAQEARSYALVTALAVLSTCLFVKLTERASARRFAAYGAGLALLGAVSIFGPLIVAAHAVPLWRRHRALARGWTATVLAVAVVLAPLAWVTSRQRDQVAWLPKPSPGEIWVLVSSLAGSSLLLAPVALAAGYGLARARGLRGVALPWLLVPPVLLMAVSLVTPLYTFRYVLFCLPAASLAAGAGLARLASGWRLAAGVLLVALAVPGHIQLRQQDSRIDDLRAMDAILRANARPGDGLLFACGADRRVMAPYGSTYRRLVDVALDESPAHAGTMTGTSSADPETAARLGRVNRVWVLGLGDGSPCRDGKEALLRAAGGFAGPGGAGRWHFRGGTLLLTGRRAPAAPGPTAPATGTG